MTFTWESSLITVIAFVILLLLLKRYAFGPLFGIMEQRSEMIKNQIETAEKNRLDSEQLLQEQRQAIQEARKEAYDIIEQARQTSSKQADAILEQARLEAQRMKEDALKDIENEKNKAVAVLRSQVSAMSVLIASKIIEKQIDENAHKSMIDQYLAEVGENK